MEHVVHFFPDGLVLPRIFSDTWERSEGASIGWGPLSRNRSCSH